MADTIVELSELEVPSQSEKLHPHENEPGTTDDDGKPVDYTDLLEMEEDELTDWDRFRVSVGYEPDYPVQVHPKNNGVGFHLIDGDRRVRALEENGATEVKAEVVDGDLSEAEVVARSIRANEQRENNDPERLAWNTAQYVAPWLLPPGERKHDISDDQVQPIDTYQFAKECSVDQSTVSKWMKPIREKHPIRTVLAAGCRNRQPTATQAQQIDEIVSYLRSGGEDGNRVIPATKEASVADDLADIEDVSIREIRDASERAAQEGMNHREFIEYIRDAYEPDTSSTRTVSTESDDEPDFGSQVEETPETATSTQSATTSTKARERAEEIEAQMEEEEEEPEPELPFEGMEKEVEWSDLVEDDDLPPSITVGAIENRRVVGEPMNGDAAVGLHLLSQIYEVPLGDIVEEFVEPLVIRATANHLGGEVE